MGHEQKSAKTFDSYLINTMYSFAISVSKFKKSSEGDQ